MLTPGRQLSPTQEEPLEQRFEAFASQPVDGVFPAPDGWRPSCHQTTLASPVTIKGPATYHRGQTVVLTLSPASDGWSFQRDDLPGQPAIQVAPAQIASSNRSIILSQGDPCNRMQMTEHIIALRLGLELDNLTIHTQSSDPPLFDHGSRPLIDAIQKAGIIALPDTSVDYYTPVEPVTLPGPHGSFLHFEPATGQSRLLSLDVALDFPTAIGRQRIQFDLHPQIFSYGAQARTNCSRFEYFLLKTLGRFSKEYGQIGYTRENILVAGKTKYATTPRLEYQGKSLEAVWHRSCLDLLAALSLFPHGRLAGRLISYKAGHQLDCHFITLLTQQGLLRKL